MNGIVLEGGKAAARKLNELARHRMALRLLQDIRTDLTICEIEGWDKREYIEQLRSMLNELGKEAV